MSITTKRTTVLLAAALALPLLGAVTPAAADQRDGQFGHHSYRDSGNDQRDNGYRHIADARDDNRRGDDDRRDNGNKFRNDKRPDDGNRRYGEPDRGHDRRNEQREHILREMPHGYRTMRIRDRDYYVHQGHYYLHEPRGFVMVQLPIGAFVMSLPDGFLHVRIGAISYFAAGGIYYRAYNGGYTVVAPPAPPPDAIGNASGRVVVNVPLLNVRNGPSYDFKVTGVVNRGDSLPVYGQAPGWHYVQLPSGSYGWVNDSYTVVAPDQPQG